MCTDVVCVSCVCVCAVCVCVCARVCVCVHVTLSEPVCNVPLHVVVLPNKVSFLSK